MDKNYFDKPVKIEDSRFRYDAFKDGKVLYGKKHFPPMGWNSWNAFGSGNTEELTKAMADRIVELGLDKLGYQYVVLDDGCYGAERIDGHVEGDSVKFPSGFMAMSEYIHGKGLKFGMYNDIGSRLCSGLEVGTCGYEDVDTADYIKWGVDFIKVDNCYNVWDNATFSDPENARFTFAPGIKKIVLENGQEKIELSAVKDGIITGNRAYKEGEYIVGIGTFDGTAPDASPIGELSSELRFKVNVETEGEYDLTVFCKNGKAEGIGSWLQAAVGEGEKTEIFYDDLVEVSDDRTEPIKIKFAAGENLLRLMNHRRQENTLTSYARIQEGFAKTGSDRDIVFSICEWGKTHPHNWGYKVGDTWRILNDITFQVGSDGDSGHASWEGAYTTSVTAQYNKAVIMDEFAGLDRGWNDPDMLMIGMDGLTETMNKTHMTMWCMMNAPLMLGMDLRNVTAGDAVYNIITNDELIALNQDELGVQAKRIYTTKAVAPDTTYIRDNDRLDVLAKPLMDGSIALSFINVGMGDRPDTLSIKPNLIMEYLSGKMVDAESFAGAERYEVKDLWSKEKKIYDAKEINEKGFTVSGIKANDNVTLRITPIYD